jgi:hypothetical protein
MTHQFMYPKVSPVKPQQNMGKPATPDPAGTPRSR